MDALQVNFYLGNQCNRSCTDCYYPKEPSQMMDLKMVKEISNWLRDLCLNDKVIYFKSHLLGGEPLLFSGVLFALVDNLLRLPVKPHPDGMVVLFTNGDFLSAELLRECKRRDIKILINPTNEPLKRVEGKIKLVKEICGGCSLAVTLDAHNLERLPEIGKLAVKHHCHTRVNRLYNGGSIPGYVEEFKEQMIKFFEILLSAEWAMWPNFILESTYPTWEGPKNPHFCGRSFLAVDPDGDIRSCNADLDTKIGTVFTHRKMGDFTFPQRWSSKNIPECQYCEWAPGGWCQSGCPYTRKLTYGTYDRKSPFCEAFRVLFPMLSKLKDRWANQRK